MEKTQPNWSAEARLPKTIRLPVQIANALYGVGSGRREIVIRRPDEPVDALIIRWMRGTPQYRTWFLDDAKESAESLGAVSATVAGESVVAKSEAQPFDTVEDVLDALDKPVGEPVPELPSTGSGTAEGDEPKRQRRKKTADEE